MDYSIIIPAFNEERWLPATLKNLLSIMPDLPGEGEVIVVDNNSTDRTAEIAHRMGARVVSEAVNQISRARNAGARAAKGRFLIFIDADTIAPRALIENALRALRSGHALGGGSTLVMDRPLRWPGRLIISAWNRVSTLFQLAAGSFVYCRRDAFDAVGGFSEEVYAGEEIFLSAALKRWGARHGFKFRVLDSDPVVTSARKLDWFGEIRLLGAALLFLFFPAAIRSRALCGIWYQRPKPPPSREEIMPGDAGLPGGKGSFGWA